MDSLLLDALSINQTQLVLSFSHLAVGGAYLSATNSTHLLASIRLLTGGGVAVEVGSGGGDVVIEADGNSTVQVRDNLCPSCAFAGLITIQHNLATIRLANPN